MKDELLKNCEEEVRGTLIKMEEAGFLLKDGKQVLAYHKLNGAKQKLSLLFKKILEQSLEKEIENHTNK